MSGGWQPGRTGPDEANPFAHRDAPQPGYGPAPATPGGQGAPHPGAPTQPGGPTQPGMPGQPMPPQAGPPQPGYAPGQPQWQPTPPKPRKAKWPIFLVLAIVLVVLCGGGAGGGYLAYRKFSGTDNNRYQASGPAYPAPAGGTGKGWQAGEPGASRKVEVFMDLGCPPCKSTHTAIKPALDKAVASGDTQVLLYPVAFTGEPAKRAANAFACTSLVHADPKDSLKYLDILFQHQPTDETKGFDADDLIDLAPSAFRRNDTFDGCVRTEQYGSWVGSVGDTAQQRGITGVPAVFVNGKKIDQPTADAVTSALG
ncbi:MAG TPA: thioredoxin domain-containing protein [Actinocatenispora sp.]